MLAEERFDSAQPIPSIGSETSVSHFAGQATVVGSLKKPGLIQKTKTGRRTHFRQQVGFSLIELMISGVVLGLTVMGAATLWRSGRDHEKFGDLRRQASAILCSALESPTYHFANFGSMTGSISSPILDSASSNPVTANLEIQVANPDSVLWGTGSEAQQIRYRKVSAMIKWSLHGKSDSLRLEKRVTPIRWSP